MNSGYRTTDPYPSKEGHRYSPPPTSYSPNPSEEELLREVRRFRRQSSPGASFLPVAFLIGVATMAVLGALTLLAMACKRLGI